jgi:AcrR family transcriptional regulator
MRGMGEPVRKRSVREARQAMYRELILEAAEGIFAQHGFERAKVHDIASEAGIAPATFYGVYEGKLAIYRAVHEHRGQQLMEASIAGLDLSGSPLAVMLDGIGAYLRFHFDHANYLRMHLQEGIDWSISSNLRSEEQVALWEQGTAMTAGLFQRGIAEKIFIEDEPLLMARTMISMHQVRLADWVDKKMPKDTTARIRMSKQQLIRGFCRAENIASLLNQHGLQE